MVTDLMVAILNAEDALEENRTGFPRLRYVEVWESDLKVLIKAAKKQAKRERKKNAQR